jgi:hypothetical protein
MRRCILAFAIQAAVGLAAAIALPQVGLAQSNLGTWKLNVAKSTYSPGPAPKSQTLNFEGRDKI